MKAVVRHRYGLPEVLAIEDLPAPELTDDRMLVRVHAASVNPLDWHEMTGTPWLMRMQSGVRRPKEHRLGADFAGVVEAVGAGVTRFRVGDEVFGIGGATFAELTRVREDGAVALKPSNLSFVEAASVPVAALTALQGLRDHGRLQPGQRVLINGAAGGVGTFATQLAKAYGAHVTAVCGPRNVDMVRSLGADRVVDYSTEDFTRIGERFDLLLDVAGGRRWRHCRRVLTGRAILVIAGGQKGGPLLGPIADTVRMKLRSVGAPQRVVLYIAKPNQADITTLAGMLEAGTIRPVVERTYPLTDVAAAVDYSLTGHARAKLVLTVP
jgi:NADPH:quinone reductase-like Zn-dependent oxidoreductase